MRAEALAGLAALGLTVQEGGFDLAAHPHLGPLAALDGAPARVGGLDAATCRWGVFVADTRGAALLLRAGWDPRVHPDGLARLGLDVPALLARLGATVEEDADGRWLARAGRRYPLERDLGGGELVCAAGRVLNLNLQEPGLHALLELPDLGEPAAWEVVRGVRLVAGRTLDLDRFGELDRPGLAALFGAVRRLEGTVPRGAARVDDGEPF